MSDLATAPAEPAAATDVAPDLDASMEASLGAIWDRAEGTAPPAGHNGGPEIETETPAPEGPVRDEYGRFAAKAPPEPETPAEAPQPEGVTAPESGAPDGWPADASVRWSELKPGIQAALRADLDAGRLHLRPPAASAQPDPLRQIVEPYSTRLAIAGVAPEQYVQSVLATADAMERDPMGTLQALAQHYRVDLATLAPKQPDSPQWVDPEVQALRTELAAIKSQISGVTQAEQMRQRQSAEAEVNAWAKDKAHFPAVRGEMAKLVQAGLDLDAAYMAACAINPAVREAQAKAEETRRREEAARHAAQARQAAAVNVRSAPTGSPARPGSVEDSLYAAYDRATAA